MNPLALAEALHFRVINPGQGAERRIKGIYCCDLLSIVMGRAKAGDAWITVMGNINSVAVAVLADVSCIVLSEEMQFDYEALEKAMEQEVCVLASGLPTYETALAIGRALSL